MLKLRSASVLGMLWLAVGFTAGVVWGEEPPAFVAMWGQLGTGSGEFNRCADVAAGASGTIYAADYANGRIQRFQADGTFLDAWLRAGLKTSVSPERDPEGDDCARKEHEGPVVRWFYFPADEEPAKTVVPTVRTFDLPAPGLATAARPSLFASVTDVRFDAPPLQTAVDVLGVVCLVEATVLRTLPSAWDRLRDGVDRRKRGATVVEIRSTDRHPDRDPAAVDRDVPLAAPLGAVCRVRARKTPPFGAFTIAASIEAQSHWMPFFKS